MLSQVWSLQEAVARVRQSCGCAEETSSTNHPSEGTICNLSGISPAP